MRQLIIIGALLPLVGCSVFFNPDSHLDGPTDSGTDTGDVAPPDTPIDTIAPPDAPDGGTDAPTFCDATLGPHQWGGSLVRSVPPLEPIISVAITSGDPPLANLAHVVDIEARIRRIDLDQIDADAGTDFLLSDVMRRSDPPPLPNSFVIRRGRNEEELAINLVGEPQDITTTGSGLYVGVLDPVNNLLGSVLYAESPPAARGLEPAIITGSPATPGRQIVREQRGTGRLDTPVWGAIAIGDPSGPSTPLSGPDVPLRDTGVWGTGSDGFLAMLGTETPNQMLVWTGFGNPQMLAFTVNDLPYVSDLALLDTDRYVVTYPGNGALFHRVIDCEFACTGPACELSGDCPPRPQEDTGRTGTMRAMVATDHVEGVGAAVVLGEEQSGGQWDISLTFIDTNANAVLDSSGVEVAIPLFSLSLPDNPFALDIDTLVRGDRVTVLVAMGHITTEGPEVTMVTWEGVTCPP